MDDSIPNYHSTGYQKKRLSSVLSHHNDDDDESFDDSFSYEHFPVVCPTCQGAGEIEDEADTGMMHFVPVKDERLRPAWMKVKIVSLILVILVVGGATTFFLFPRTVSLNISLDQVQTFNFRSINPWIQYSFALTIINDNFFPVRIKEGKLQLLYQNIIITAAQETAELSVESRSSHNHFILLNATYEVESSGKYINEQCYCGRDYVGQQIMLSARLSYWLHDQTIQSNDNYFYTDCSRMVFPLPTKNSYHCKVKRKSNIYHNVTHVV